MTDELQDLMFGDLHATVRVRDLPASREVVAVERTEDGGWRVCGSAKANADGIANLAIEGSKTSLIYAVAMDHWGEPFAANKEMAFGDIVRPSVFSGWMYRVTTPGEMPAEEPAWWNSMPEIPRPVGSALMQAERHYQPIAHGPVDIEWEEAPPEPDLPTIIGQEFGGGFYAGDIEDNGQMYKLIVADIEADVYSLAWMSPHEDWPQAASITNGLGNTQSMAGDARFLAGNHCLDWRGGGFADWYMPAKDELNVLYLGLKPSASDCPDRFKTGRDQAFHASHYYWTSTQYSSTRAWGQRFSDGNQYGPSKNATDIRVRPVRRLPFNI